MSENIIDKWEELTPKEKAAAMYVVVEIAEISRENRPHVIDSWLSEKFPLLGERMKIAQKRRENVIHLVREVSKNLFETLEE